MLKDVVDYQKTVFEAGFNTMVIMQGQAEQLWGRFCSDFAFFDETNVVDTMVKEFKKERDTVKKMIDQGFGQLMNAMEP